MSLNAKTQFFMIRALPDPNAKESLSTFYGTVGCDMSENEIHIIDEKETREDTLNHIFTVRDRELDLFVFVDDIRFRPGWWQALNKASEVGDIVGFSMIDANTGLLQDFGYDFVTIDSHLTYQGLYKHCDPSSIKLPRHRECSAVCGCAMWIRKDVLHVVPEVPLEGQNRWGELLFSAQAKKCGFKTVVTANHLEHFGTSTKNKADIKLSSLSWLVERDIWQVAAKTYLNEVEITQRTSRKLSVHLQEIISTSDRIIIYGCGTIADFIGQKLARKKFHIVAGLAEEIGKEFLGLEILDAKEFEYAADDSVIITPIGYRGEIEPLFSGCSARIVWIDVKLYPNEILYDASV